MATPLAASLSFSSVLLIAQAAAGAPLTQQEISQPDAVVAWLRQNEGVADKAFAQQAFDEGLQTKKRKDWGASIKAFGDSSAHYPTPRALIEYAEAYLRMLGQLKPRNKPSPEEQRRQLATGEATYRAALAADTVLKQLTDQERKQTQQNADCLAEYLKSSVKPRHCLPLDMYRVNP